MSEKKHRIAERGELRLKRHHLARALGDLKARTDRGLGTSTGQRWLLPVVAAGLGLTLALALRRRLQRPVED